jgi:hypothetical protein
VQNDYEGYNLLHGALLFFVSWPASAPKGQNIIGKYLPREALPFRAGSFTQALNIVFIFKPRTLILFNTQFPEMSSIFCGVKPCQLM